MILEFEKQVTRFDLCKRLKELGFPQGTLHYWATGLDDSDEKGKPFCDLIVHSKLTWYTKFRNFDYFSAPTVAELGVELIKTHYPVPVYSEHYKKFFIAISGMPRGYSDTEADARAELMIHLLERKIVDYGKDK